MNIRHVCIFLIVLLVFSGISFAATYVLNGSGAVGGVCVLSGTDDPWGNDDLPNVSIQDAIDFASAGDTIIVCLNGTSSYMESIVINKSISIFGNETGVIVNASDILIPVFNVSNDDISIANFTLRDANDSSSAYANGLYANSRY